MKRGRSEEKQVKNIEEEQHDDRNKKTRRERYGNEEEHRYK
jgi:hypothetical protein